MYKYSVSHFYASTVYIAYTLVRKELKIKPSIVANTHSSKFPSSLFVLFQHCRTFPSRLGEDRLMAAHVRGVAHVLVQVALLAVWVLLPTPTLPTSASSSASG